MCKYSPCRCFVDFKHSPVGRKLSGKAACLCKGCCNAAEHICTEVIADSCIAAFQKSGIKQIIGCGFTVCSAGYYNTFFYPGRELLYKVGTYFKSYASGSRGGLFAHKSADNTRKASRPDC